MRIITLGTGAGRPTLQRFASATALEYEGEVFLFDCGEAAQIQLMRSPLRWGRLSAIFIGHLHGDHVNGLPGLLGTLSLSDRQEPLKLFGPRGLKKFLQVLLELKNLWIKFPTEIVEIESESVLIDTPSYQVHSAPLKHVIECWGFAFREKPRRGPFDPRKADALKIPEGPLRSALTKGVSVTLADGRIVKPEEVVGSSRPGRSMAYCLDTQPCESLQRLAAGVDVMVHEATFDQTFQSEAHAWGHSTAADAARAARDAGVKRLILTHISQRYLEDTVLLEEAKALWTETELAQDLRIFEV